MSTENRCCAVQLLRVPCAWRRVAVQLELGARESADSSAERDQGVRGITGEGTVDTRQGEHRERTEIIGRCLQPDEPRSTLVRAHGKRDRDGRGCAGVKWLTPQAP